MADWVEHYDPKPGLPRWRKRQIRNEILFRVAYLVSLFGAAILILELAR